MSPGAFGSYLGGSGEDGSSGAGSWLDGKGDYFIPGFTDSTDFPVTPGAFQTENGGAFDVFLVKVDLGNGTRAPDIRRRRSRRRSGRAQGRGPGRPGTAWAGCAEPATVAASTC